jgi:hypothetical protein
MDYYKFKKRTTQELIYMKNHILVSLFSIAAAAVLFLSACSGNGSHSARSDMRNAQIQTGNNTNVHTEARFRGGSFARPGANPSGTIGGTYHSGYRSPSSNVTNPPPGSPSRAPAAGIGGGLWPHIGTFGAGMLLGSIFHPFGGGGYGGYGGGGSIFGMIFWIVILFLAYRAIRSLFFRSRYK